MAGVEARSVGLGGCSQSAGLHQLSARRFPAGKGSLGTDRRTPGALEAPEHCTNHVHRGLNCYGTLIVAYILILQDGADARAG